ncbi:MAG: flagellar export chaperone FliS [Fimbriimonadaceae bacterium]|nr:flagellar export chaperone FliS [Fimbriimonadaceae bacterium]
MYAPALETYRRQQVETASPMQLVRMLYDAMLQATRDARVAIEQRDFEDANDRLLHAQRIVEELDHAVDEQKGGDIARNLRRLYDFLLQRLTYVNITKSLPALEDTEMIMEEMHSMWSTVPGWEL